MSCAYVDSTRKLTITNLFASGVSAAASETLVFTVSNVRNPINTNTMSGFTIETQDASGYSIDSGTSATLTVTTAADITTA